jgi:hypothetical protein
VNARFWDHDYEGDRQKSLDAAAAFVDSVLDSEKNPELPRASTAAPRAPTTALRHPTPVPRSDSARPPQVVENTPVWLQNHVPASRVSSLGLDASSAPPVAPRAFYPRVACETIIEGVAQPPEYSFGGDDSLNGPGEGDEPYGFTLFAGSSAQEHYAEDAFVHRSQFLDF